MRLEGVGLDALSICSAIGPSSGCTCAALTGVLVPALCCSPVR
jgi:hypothetical protein